MKNGFETDRMSKSRYTSVCFLPGLAFVILAVENLGASLLARRAILVAALSVASMLPAVLHVLALHTLPVPQAALPKPLGLPLHGKS